MPIDGGEYVAQRGANTAQKRVYIEARVLIVGIARVEEKSAQWAITRVCRKVEQSHAHAHQHYARPHHARRTLQVVAQPFAQHTPV